MGIGILDALIPARFILTMGHLVSLLTLAYTIKVCGQDCESTLSRMPGEYGKAKKEFETIVILSLTCFVFDLMGIFIGTSLFFSKGKPPSDYMPFRGRVCHLPNNRSVLAIQLHLVCICILQSALHAI